MYLDPIILQSHYHKPRPLLSFKVSPPRISSYFQFPSLKHQRFQSLYSKSHFSFFCYPPSSWLLQCYFFLQDKTFIFPIFLNCASKRSMTGLLETASGALLPDLFKTVPDDIIFFSYTVASDEHLL